MTIDTQTLARRASIALERRDRTGLIAAVNGLLDNRAPMVQGWKSLCEPLLDFGELDLARRAIDRYVMATGSSPIARFDQALIYVRAGKPEAAMGLLDSLPPTVPDRAGHAYLRGTIALNLGKLDEARAALLEAAIAQPARGQIWQSLSMLGSLAKDGEVADRILGAEAAMRSAGDGDRAPYLYALGKLHDEMGDVDRAFAAFSDGAAIVARQRPYDAAFDRRVADHAVRGWTADRLSAVGADISVSTRRPIILTGLPRSGSTLVEQILASHSQVGGGEELGRFGLVAAEVGGTAADDLTRWSASHRPDEAAQLYLHLIGQRFPGSSRIVDKTLDASRYLGLLAAIMPEASLLWMRRDPLDNAWSAFHTYFLAGVPWSWSLSAIAEHFRQEDELLERWQAVLGERLLVVDYQSLVTDKHEMIPRVLAHCGLDVEDQVFHPERSRRLVTTASVTQVRQPISTKAVGSARRYERHLAPFIMAYGH